MKRILFLFVISSLFSCEQSDTWSDKLQDFKPNVIKSENNLLETNLHLGMKVSELKENGFVFSGSPENYYSLDKQSNYNGTPVEYDCLIIYYNEAVTYYSVGVKMDTQIHKLFPKIDTINIYKKGSYNWYYLVDSAYMEAYRWVDLRGSRTEKFNYELQYLTRYNPHYYNSGNLQDFENYFDNPSMW
jgi:hypothetical protein